MKTIKFLFLVILITTVVSHAKRPNEYEGCSPGFWKNHVEEWAATGWNPEDSFSDVFGVGPNISLLEALNTGGGGANALGRHAVAAILNASHPEIDYLITVDEVIAEVQAALGSGEPEDIEDTKDYLDQLNNLGCFKDD